jgi:hypothetical protein
VRRFSQFLLALAACCCIGRAWAAPQPSEFQKHSALFLMKCSKCHTIGGGARVGPDLYGVANRRGTDWILSFIMNPDSYLDTDPTAKRLLVEHNGVRMENTHLTRAEAVGLLDFIKAASKAPVSARREDTPAPEDPLYKKLKMPEEGRGVSAPGLVLLLLIFAAAVLSWQFGFRGVAALLVVAALATAYWTFGGRRHYRLLGIQQGYEPAQPIAFSHAMHAGKLEISCFYCHSGAEHSDTAGVPALNVCMNCHSVVRARGGHREPSAEIARLVEAWESRQKASARSIEWIRVHHLPDYVHFSHRAHIANNIQCQECHGPVQSMDRIRQASSLSMGWCISCHRLTPQTAPTHWKRTRGPLDCAACHW